MIHTDVKMDEFAAGLIFPLQPQLWHRTYLHESDQIQG